MCACAGIIGGLFTYVVINGLNWIIDKIGEFSHWTMTGSDTQLPVQLDRSNNSFAGRTNSNTGGAGQVRITSSLTHRAH